MQYDVVIVGGGSAGCTLAARLSEASHLRILLIEAGDDVGPDRRPEDIADIFPRAYANPRYFWPSLKASTLPEAALEGYSQARILGGGSNVMGMWAVRGLPDDYDGWQRLGADGWGYADVLPYFRQLETDADFTGDAHGREGPVPIRRVPMAGWPGFNRAAAEALARQGLAFREDLNADARDGIYPLPLSIDEDGRVSAESAYLTLAARRRGNLEIRANTEVTSLLWEGTRARGVAVRRSDGSHEKIAAREVVVAAGAIHSPALLLRSGVGNAPDLVAQQIPVVAGLAEVGRNLQNHVFVHFGMFLKAPARQNPGDRYYAMTCARLSSGLAGCPAGDLLLSVIARAGAHDPGNRIGTLGAHLYAPTSRGSVELGADGAPVVRFNALSTPEDRSRTVQIARKAWALINDPAMAGLISEPFLMPPKPPVKLLNQPGWRSRLISSGLNLLSELPSPIRRATLAQVLGRDRLLKIDMAADEFEALVLRSVTPMFHPVGTCAIGKVVDKEARVFGTRGLRVVDASIMPAVPRANTNIPTIMVAERCAQLIKQSLTP